MTDITLVILIHELFDDTVEKIIEYLPFFDEILFICQNDSSKKTHQKKVSIRIVKFNNDFAQLRNAAFPYISSDWAFFLDSDEKITPDLLQSLSELTKTPTIDGYWLRRKTYISPTRYLKYGLFYPDYQLRLFRVEDKYRFKGELHEVINIPYEKTRELKQDIVHLPKAPKYTSFKDYINMKNYIEIYAKELKKEKKSQSYYFLLGISKGIYMFLSGFIRGKGFLDGWAGFRAHLLFSRSITDSYLLAAYEIQEKTI